MTELVAIVVGAGQAGLGVSYLSPREGRPRLVLERDQVGESWLAQRWDSFRLNMPNSLNVLPGSPYEGPEPDGFWSRNAYVAYLRSHVDTLRLPIRSGATVVSVEQGRGDGRFVVRTTSGGQEVESLSSRSVVIASGGERAPRFCAIRSR